MKIVSIVVPVYKTFAALTKAERISLDQLYSVLGNHPITLIGPKQFDWDGYFIQAANSGVTLLTCEFDGFYFQDITGYNRLLISKVFYNIFSNYKYVLIYQTDAYVFKDELEEWCRRGYDYIGAPWNGMYSWELKPLVGVGNGGFSLRKVKSALYMLNMLRTLEVLEFYQNFNWKGIVLRLPQLAARIYKARGVPGTSEREYHWQEDIFWCKYAPQLVRNFYCNSVLLKLISKLLLRNRFQIAPPDIARQFSFESQPASLYKENGEQLPFGCHAWEKYEPHFWRQFIPVWSPRN